MVKKRYLAVGGGLAIAAVAAIVVAVVALSGGGGGTSDVSVADAPGTSEGITVHGHWVIEVREPDGALVSRHEFDNALGYGGAETLAELLARDVSMGWWQIEVDTISDGYHWCEGVACTIAEPTAPNAGDPGVFPNLVVSVVGGGDELQLSGSFTPPSDDSIDDVITYASTCVFGEPLENCAGVIPLYGFSYTTLGTPVSVLAGQQVLVRVTFSFS